jgi:hypothetical protein
MDSDLVEAADTDLEDELGNKLTDHAAEQALIGYLLWRPDAAAEAKEFLSPSLFHQRELGRVFEGIIDLGGLAPENDQILEWLGGDKVEIAGRTGKQLIGYLRACGNAIAAEQLPGLIDRIATVGVQRLEGEGESNLIGRNAWQSKMGAITFADRNSVTAHEIEDLVEDLIPERGLVIVMGETSTGKSFVTSHLGFSIAQGKDFFDRRVLEARPVVWCCYEGGTGARRRMLAYSKHFNVEQDVPFTALTEPFDLWQNEKNVEELAGEVEGLCQAEFGGRRPGALIIDTHNAANSGASEVDSEVVSKIRDRYNYLSKRLNCPVIIVGHTNALGKHRGNEQLTNNVPTILTVSYKTRVEQREKIQIKDNDDRPVRTLHVQKQREGETGADFDFVLPRVNTGLKNKFGKERTSCVVVPPNWTPADKDASGTSKQQRAKMLGPIQTGYFKAFWEALQEYGETAPPQTNLPRSTRVVKTGFVLKVWNQRQSPDMNQNTSKTRRQRAETYFQNKGILKIDNDAGVMWWTGRYVPDLEETHSRQRSMFDDADERRMLPADEFPPDD